jgi:hypothetical protein
VATKPDADRVDTGVQSPSDADEEDFVLEYTDAWAGPVSDGVVIMIPAKSFNFESTSEDADEDPAAPTGINTQMTPYILLLGAACGAVGIDAAWRRKRKVRKDR